LVEKIYTTRDELEEALEQGMEGVEEGIFYEGTVLDFLKKTANPKVPEN
jgi:hypothetical protein